MTDLLNASTSQNISFSTATQRYIVGPTVELRLPFGLGIEFDALYRRLNFQGSSSLIDVITNNRTTGNAWEFPLLAKYRLPSKVVRPFVDAGFAWDTLQGLSQSITTTLAPNRTTTTTTSNPSQLAHNTTTGFVLGAGIDIKALVIHVSPEVRYTRWGSQHFIDPSGLLHSNQNQAEFLLGITF